MNRQARYHLPENTWADWAEERAPKQTCYLQRINTPRDERTQSVLEQPTRFGVGPHSHREQSWPGLREEFRGHVQP